MKRIAALQQSETQKEASQLNFQVQKDKLQLQADLLATQSQLASKKQELVTLRSNLEWSPIKDIQLQDEIESLEKGEKALQKLEKDLF